MSTLIAGKLNKSKINEIGLLMDCIVYAQTLDHFDEFGRLGSCYQRWLF